MISPLAYVHPDARLGADVTVEPFAYIAGDVEIGDGSWIGPGAVVHDGARLGKRCRVHTAASVACLPQDLKFAGEKTLCEIGDDNDIREYVTISRGTASTGTTRIGDGNLLMAYVHVAHDCTVMNDIVMSNNATLAGHCLVEDGAIIAGLSAVHQFTRVGKHAFVGGMSGISQDLPPWMLAVGNRALVQSPNIVGLRRIRASQELVSAFKQAYRLLWFSGIPRPDALLQLEAEYGHLPEIGEFIAFVRSSERGILPAEERKRD